MKMTAIVKTTLPAVVRSSQVSRSDRSARQTADNYALPRPGLKGHLLDRRA